MKTREEALAYGLSFPYTYKEAPFHDQNWELVRVHGSKKAFLWVYERNGYINMNVKVNPEWRDFWRKARHSRLRRKTATTANSPLHIRWSRMELAYLHIDKLLADKCFLTIQ